MVSGVVEAVCDRCNTRCGLAVIVEDGRMVNVENATCPKGLAIPEFIHHPDRIVYPLRRVGGRGEGKWKRISCDEALQESADNFKRILEKYGRGAVTAYLGDSRHPETVTATIMFADFLGLPNLMTAGQMCINPDMIAERATIGAATMIDVGPDVWHANCIFVWGSNPTETRPVMGRAMLAAKNERDAKLIVVDPRPTPVAKEADIWLRVRPGTDVALALAVLNVIINEELYDKKFVEKWCLGFEKLKERVQRYPPEWAAEIAWVSKEKIVEAARLYARTKPACVHIRLGAGGGQINSTQTSRAICLLMCLTGNIDIEGGNLLPHPCGGFRRYRPREVFRSRMRAVRRSFWMRRAAGEFPLYGTHNPTTWQAVHDGRIKGMYIVGSNPVVSDADSRYVWEALKKLDWLVVSELFMTPTAELADIVLPGAVLYEVEGGPFIPLRYPGNFIIWSDKIVEPRGECRDDREFVIELVKRMGIKPRWETVEEFFDWQLEPLRIKYGGLKAMYPDKTVTFPREYKTYERNGFRTPSGKVELYSRLFERLGYDPLPDYMEPPQSPVSTPELFKEYPLILINFRELVYFKSEGRNIPSLRKLSPNPTVEINPETARQLGIEGGDPVWLETPRFKGMQVKGRAKLVPGLHPRVVAMPFLWWLPEKTGPDHGCFEVGINTIISHRPPWDPIQGTPQEKNVLCKIGKVHDI